MLGSVQRANHSQLAFNLRRGWQEHNFRYRVCGMPKLGHRRNGLPESYRVAILAALLASVGWFAVKLLTHCARVISGFYKKRKLGKIEFLTRAVWELSLHDERGPALHPFEHLGAQRSDNDTTVRKTVAAVHRWGAGSNGHYLRTGANSRFRGSGRNKNQVLAVNRDRVVSRVGLEPTTRCLRGSCSTIELPAH
jgi:hypothetical protein